MTTTSENDDKTGADTPLESIHETVITVWNPHQVGPFVIFEGDPVCELGIRPNRIVGYHAEEDDAANHRTLHVYLSSGAVFHLRIMGAARDGVAAGDGSDEMERWRAWDATMELLLRDAQGVVDRLP